MKIEQLKTYHIDKIGDILQGYNKAKKKHIPIREGLRRNGKNYVDIVSLNNDDFVDWLDKY